MMSTLYTRHWTTAHTSETYRRFHERYMIAERGSIEVKGKGEMVTYLLMGRKTLHYPQVRSASP